MRSLQFIILVILFLNLSACKKENFNEEHYLTIEFISSESPLVNNTNFKLEVYGFDPNISDVQATMITRQEFSSSKFPFTLKIKIPENAASKISPVSNIADAQYYLNINWDSDNNGKICKGDISFDYTSHFPSLLINDNGTQTFHLKTITTECNN